MIPKVADLVQERCPVCGHFNTEWDRCLHVICEGCGMAEAEYENGLCRDCYMDLEDAIGGDE